MKDYKDQLETLKVKAEEQKIEKVKLEERLSNLKKEQKSLLDELDELNIKPEELDKKIETLKKEIEEGLQNAEV